jgi:tyrosine-protein kinase Etk/Wzc
MQHGNLKKFLEKVSAEYDLVLLDTLPVLAVTMLNEHVGSSILVAREGITTLGELNETVKRFTQIGSKVKGVLFNGQLQRISSNYGYSYGYKYGGYKRSAKQESTS